jgi:ATP-dependent RNA helicase DeaD|tara:strand:- start:174 stop:1343 length:1170 start_codon:yes stop_codon:yes gene_type:complete
MQKFSDLSISLLVLDAIKKLKLIKPTPIQKISIPLALEGNDILGTAQTGTGKTYAFGIPLINHLTLDKDSYAIILTPTRELALQVSSALKDLTSMKNIIDTAVIIGGDSIQKQLKQLKKARLVVGTPGRIHDHIRRKSLKLSKFNFLVLDETDRMLDMGFVDEIKSIIEKLPSHQTLLFSATLPKKISDIAKNFMTNPQRVNVGEENTPLTNIKQEIKNVNQKEKFEHLKLELLEINGSVVLFVKTKRSADKIALKLRKDKFNAEAIHGDLRQSKREKVILKFRKNRFQILVATDVAARGLDIPHIEHVINYDIPQNPEDYIHRIGRTARAGAKGRALTFLTDGDKKNWNAIGKLINPNAPAPKSKLDSRRKKSKKSYRKFKKKYFKKK